LSGGLKHTFDLASLIHICYTLRTQVNGEDDPEDNLNNYDININFITNIYNLSDSNYPLIRTS